MALILCLDGSTLYINMQNRLQFSFLVLEHVVDKSDAIYIFTIFFWGFNKTFAFGDTKKVKKKDFLLIVHHRISFNFQNFKVLWLFEGGALKREALISKKKKLFVWNFKNLLLSFPNNNK